MAQIFTIGHSNHDITDFLSLLKKHQISVVADVRSEPYSRQRPQFSKAELERFLLADKYQYIYLGDTLGGHPKDPILYTPRGILNYDKITANQDFQNKIEYLVNIAREQNTVLLCSEGLPNRCHRESILGNYLRQLGHRVLHILPNGGITEIKQLKLL